MTMLSDYCAFVLFSPDQSILNKNNKGPLQAGDK